MSICDLGYEAATNVSMMILRISSLVLLLSGLVFAKVPGEPGDVVDDVDVRPSSFIVEFATVRPP